MSTELLAERDWDAFEHTYAALPDEFHARVAPTPVSQPGLLRFNRELAAELGLSAEALESPEGVELLAGNRLPGSGDTIAMAYAGHQFGNFTPSLGDGRAILLGEVVDRGGVRRDVQLKGSGPTPFSRRGDGRAALGPVVREYVVSEAMAALGVPTTRALAMVTTGDPVYRERAEPGAILTRISAGHVRVGTFQYFHARERHDAVRTLADYVIGRQYPEVRESENPYLAFLDAVIARQADLIARWVLVGFIHGVMNTDNSSVVGETIDYGPCAFMDTYDAGTVYSSIDHGGRYAYGQQPGIGQWNLTRLAETLLPLLASEEEAAIEAAKESLGRFGGLFEGHYHAGLCRKLGLEGLNPGNLEVAVGLLETMAAQHADFTLSFRRLSGLGDEASARDAPARELFDDPAAFDAWLEIWRERVRAEGHAEEERQAVMRQVNPAFIPRNHQVQRVIDATAEGDLRPLEELCRVTTRPFDEHPGLEEYERPPEPHEVVRQTFCGT